ncbi:hypothetical protein IFR05_005309 [Cadophora sp. M221]|nr:hypothetical protein IFR05_005309 [Cadophora sp. M221]
MALDYSGFAMLKTLEIHDCFIFDKAFISRISRVDRPPVHNYKSYIGDLHERLPNHLETLKINFHSGSEVLEKVTKPEGQAEYSWLLALAHYKDESFRRLSRVDIVQIPHCNSQGVGAGADSNTSRIAAQEWKYPPDVVKAFRGAGIALKVMFRPKLQMRR